MTMCALAEPTDMNWGATTLAIPAPSDRRERAVPSLMTRLLAVETLGWLRAIRLHVIAGQAVEAFADEVRRHRPRLRCDKRTTPAAPAVHLPVSIGVRPAQPTCGRGGRQRTQGWPAAATWSAGVTLAGHEHDAHQP